MIIKPSIILMLCIFIAFPIVKSEAQKTKEESGNMTAKELLEKADSIFRSRKYVESRDIYLEVVEKAETEKDNSLLTEAWSQVARSFLIVDDKENGKKWLQKASDIASDKEPLGWSRYLGVRGRFEWQDKDLETAVKTFKEMYDFCSANKLHDRAVDATHMIAIIVPPEEQVEWAKKGIAQAEAGKSEKWLGPLWNNLGATYEDLKQYDNAVDAYLKARDYHYKYGDDMNKLIADWAVGHAYRLAGDFDNAIKWIKPVLDRSEKLEATEFIGWSCKEIAEIEINNSNFKEALDYLIRAEKNLKAEKMPEWDPDGYKKLTEQIEEIKAKIK